MNSWEGDIAGCCASHDIEGFFIFEERNALFLDRTSHTRKAQ